MYFSRAVVAGALLQSVRASLYGQSNVNHTCALLTPQLSCSPQANHTLTDSCCSETFGGLVMSTQFWATYTGFESSGQLLPANTWTIHGLWPDFCNGSYTQYCDLKRQFDPVPSPNTTDGKPTGTPVPVYTGPGTDTFLQAFGRLDLLAYMNKFWVNRDAPNEELWAHEFSKHATCFSTFDTPCYGPQYREHEDVIEYFETTISYNNNLPTYGWLSAAGIRPSNSTHVTLADMQAALTKGFGALPYIGCAGPRFNETADGKGTLDNGRTVVAETWYFHHVFGRVQKGQALPVSASSNGLSVSNCAKTPGALLYPLRAAGAEVEV